MSSNVHRSSVTDSEITYVDKSPYVDRSTYVAKVFGGDQPHTLFRSPPHTTDTVHDPAIEEFLVRGSFSLQAPAPFSWPYLRKFMANVALHSIINSDDKFLGSGRCLLDISISDEQQDNVSKEDGKDSSVSVSSRSEKVDTDSKFGHEVVNERQLIQRLRLLSNHDQNTCRRIILHLVNMTPNYAAVLATEFVAYSGLIREYIHCNLADETELFAFIPKGSYGIARPGRQTESSELVLGFHLPYIALRYGITGTDLREVRETVPMIRPLGLKSDSMSKSDVVCHEGQLSFLLIGTSDDDWFAVSTVDNWFGGERNLSTYVREGLDGPSGGAIPSGAEKLNPRVYFLLVLSQRFRQISSEWGNTCCYLTQTLDSYETHYLNTIDSISADLHDDENMTRTRSYSKAASMLRQYYDTLARITSRLESYLQEHEHVLFDDLEKFEDECAIYRFQINWELAHLKRWCARLQARTLRFEAMREGLLSASALQESRRATTQSHDIALLTYVTILYLPFSTAAAIFGISGQLPELKAWLCWTVTSVVLAIMTCVLAFRPKVGPWIRKFQHKVSPRTPQELPKFQSRSDPGYYPSVLG